MRGLTTAAGLWVTAAIGMAAGAGMYLLAIETTALVLIGLEAFNHALRHMNRRENPSKNGENSSSDADFSSNEE